MKTVLALADPRERVDAFLTAYHMAGDIDVEFRAGATEAGIPSICISIGGDDFVFFANEARLLADVLERNIGILGAKAARAYSIPELIDGLRETAELAVKRVAS